MIRENYDSFDNRGGQEFSRTKERMRLAEEFAEVLPSMIVRLDDWSNMNRIGDGMFQDGDDVLVMVGLEDEKLAFRFNPQDFETRSVEVNEEGIMCAYGVPAEALESDGWIFVGQRNKSRYEYEAMARAYLFARVSSRKDMKMLSEVDVFYYKNIGPQLLGHAAVESEVVEDPEKYFMESEPLFELVIQSGNLRVFIEDDLSFFDAEGAVLISMGLVSGEEVIQKEGIGVRSKDLTGRSTETLGVKNTGHQLRNILLQLKQMGYARVLGIPSDERRARVYQLMGMEHAARWDEVPRMNNQQRNQGNQVLEANIDDLLRSRFVRTG